MEENFQQTLMLEVAELLRPLANAASPDIRDELLRDLGWDVDGIEGFPIASLNQAITDFATALGHFEAALAVKPPDDLKTFADSLLAAGFTIRGVLALSRVFEGSGKATPEGFQRLGKELIDYLTVNHLASRHRVAYHVLYLLTVIDDITAEAVISDSGALEREPRTRRGLRLGQLPRLISDPVGTLKAEYFLESGLTNPEATADKLFPRLLFFAKETGASAAYGVNPDDLIAFDFGPGGNQLVQHMLTVFWPLPDPRGTRTFGVGTGIALSSELGVVLRPTGTLDIDEMFAGWETRIQVAFQVEGLSVSSDGVRIPDDTSGGIQVFIEAAKEQVEDASGNLFAFRFGSATATRLEIGNLVARADITLSPGTTDYGFSLKFDESRFVISSGDGDGFIREFLPDEFSIEFDFLMGWSNRRGLYFSGAAGLTAIFPVHISLGGVLDINTIELGIRTDGSSIDLLATATFTAHLGSVIDVTAQQTGLKGLMTFPADDQESGSLGAADFSLGFQLPRGLGIVVHAGPVTGGGFIFLDPQLGRYSGALELSVFGVGVKAFGIVDTIFPDGSEGFSFVLVIVAEFTPIQLGFGFTLLGVGGLIGVHRTLDAEALGAVVRTGALAHLLFPRNPVADAPAILHDLGTVFPAARGHIVVGPMAKFGWGTPTLISADIGVVLEFPGPRVAVLGVARMQLPSPELALLRLQMAVAGVLDFPAKTFAVDAGLFDSNVVGYPVSGDMAFRMGFGSRASFLLSVGGFNPSFDAPPGVPELRRAAVDLGVNGNPSLVASGYFALTSNTAQIGAKIELRASGAGIRLHGWMGFDALFVFAPFSFTASFSAGMRVSFHGAGLGVTLRGTLSGPSPWHIKGKVCVSVLWWDACLSVDHKFGKSEPAALPEMDPWTGTPAETDARVAVIGLATAIADSRNWSGSNPPAGFAVVSLSQAATTSDAPPIDPLGAASLRQKVVPLQTELEKFGEYRPLLPHDRFFLSSVAINTVPVDISTLSAVMDDFAPAKYFEFTDAEKLSTDSYVPMQAGFTINANGVTIGSDGHQVLEYETDFIKADGQKVRDPNVYRLTQPQLVGMLKRSAAALGGVRRAGTQRYITPTKPKKVTFGPKRFIVVDSCTSEKNSAITGTGVSQIQAILALRKHVAANPADRTRFALAPAYVAP